MEELKDILSHPLVITLMGGIGILVGRWMTKTEKKIEVNTDDIQEVEKDTAVLSDARIKNDVTVMALQKDILETQKEMNGAISKLTNNVNILAEGMGLNRLDIDNIKSELSFISKRVRSRDE